MSALRKYHEHIQGCSVHQMDNVINVGNIISNQGVISILVFSHK